MSENVRSQITNNNKYYVEWSYTKYQSITTVCEIVTRKMTNFTRYPFFFPPSTELNLGTVMQKKKFGIWFYFLLYRIYLDKDNIEKITRCMNSHISICTVLFIGEGHYLVKFHLLYKYVFGIFGRSIFHLHVTLFFCLLAYLIISSGRNSIF